MFRPSKSQDWEPYRETIAALYEIMKLKDVMLEMQLSHGFKATWVTSEQHDSTLFPTANARPERSSTRHSSKSGTSTPSTSKHPST